MESLTSFATGTLLVTLRLVPSLGFAPPFTLMRIPPMVRLLVAVSLSGWMVSAFPAAMPAAASGTADLAVMAASELLIGIALALALQLAFAAIHTVGRLIDLQAGFAFATLVDPASRAQLPLIGMVFAYLAGALFFTTGGPTDMVAIWASSLEVAPVGTGLTGDALPTLLAYVSAIFVMAFAAGGMVLLTLFIIDLAIAFMSRSLPQMNVLFLGFQVKTLATMVALPAALSLSAALLLRMVRLAIETTIGLI